MIGHWAQMANKIDAHVVGKYDLEQSVLSRTGRYSASIDGTVTYVTTPQVGFQGGKYWANVDIVTNAISIPPATINTPSGSIEFIFTYTNPNATPDVFIQITSTIATRHAELYVFGGSVYYFSNNPATPYNSNTGFSVSPDTVYYARMTWDTTNIYVWLSTSPNLPATPTATFDSPRFDTATLLGLRLPATVVQGLVGPTNKYDNIVVSNVSRTIFPTL